MTEDFGVCSICVMDNSDPDIMFDENGVCNHCTRYARRVEKDLHFDEKGQVLLGNIISKIKSNGKKKDYNCIIGVSGGVDSTTVAYLAKRKFGLRPLAVHLDNGWNSELSVNNIEKTPADFRAGVRPGAGACWCPESYAFFGICEMAILYFCAFTPSFRVCEFECCAGVHKRHV